MSSIEGSAWTREELIKRARADLWRFITDHADSDASVVALSQDLLQLTSAEFQLLAKRQLLISEAVDQFLSELPSIMRRLKTSTAESIETDSERLRGTIRWGETVAMRAVTGSPYVFVTSSNQRIYDTPENRVLAYALSEVADCADDLEASGGVKSDSDLSREFQHRGSRATKQRASRKLQEISAEIPSSALLAKVRSGRRAQQYASAVKVASLAKDLLSDQDRTTLKGLLEDEGLVAIDSARLLELVCLFSIERTMKQRGWEIDGPRLVQTGESGRAIFEATRGNDEAAVFFQHTPPPLPNDSVYGRVLDDHGLRRSPLLPDLVIRLERGHGYEYRLIEVKGGEQRSAEENARAGLRDLLGYRQAFHHVLDEQQDSYGLAFAWGRGVEPARGSEVLLSTEEHLERALEFLGM